MSEPTKTATKTDKIAIGFYYTALVGFIGLVLAGLIVAFPSLVGFAVAVVSFPSWFAGFFVGLSLAAQIALVSFLLLVVGLVFGIHFDGV